MKWATTVGVFVLQASSKAAAPARTRKTYAFKPDVAAAPARGSSGSSKGKPSRLQDQPAPVHPQALPPRAKQVKNTPKCQPMGLTAIQHRCCSKTSSMSRRIAGAEAATSKSIGSAFRV
jgi:hypothetical protein